VLTSLTKPSTTAEENNPMERMVFGWWNTSLSPVGVDRADDNHREIAGKIVKWLIDGLKIDCLALGEVTDSDLAFLKTYSDNPSSTTYNGTLKEGRLQFDTGVIYDARRLTVSDEKSIIISHGGQKSKLANRIDFVSIPDNSLLHIFVSHWPSRVFTEENKRRRTTLAMRLKDQIESIRDSAPNASIILMGDFNDEPFDESLSYHLLATRDRHLAKSKKGFLYNPFWRQIGESEPHFLGNTKIGSAGSCFHKNGGNETRWRTFDQILFSPAFLGGGDWYLNEQNTMILRTETLIELVQNNTVFFDHLPILEHFLFR
jgi:hypothetical protein